MKIVKEFKEFIMRGNVMDLAVGVIIGGAFGAIVTSLTDDIISPILGIFGGMDFSDLVLDINGAHIAYGKFITAVINFLIMALIIFLLVKAVNKVMSLGKKKEAEPEPTTNGRSPDKCQGRRNRFRGDFRESTAGRDGPHGSHCRNRFDRWRTRESLQVSGTGIHRREECRKGGETLSGGERCCSG